jgi:hypothetical protein
MTRHFRIIHFVFLCIVTALFGVAMTPTVASAPDLAKATPQMKADSLSAVHAPVNQITVTPTKARQGADSLQLQAGHSDWIAGLAIFIVLIIVIPILIKHKEWRGN